MKLNEIKKEIHAMNAAEDIKSTVDGLRKGLVELRLSAATSHVKDNSQFKKIKKNIARMLTRLNSLQKSQ